jgi:MFS family permease
VTSPKESGTPGTITAGYWLVVTGAALSVLAAVYQFLHKEELVDAAMQANKDPKLTRDMAVSAMGGLLTVSLVATIVLALLGGWFAGKVRKGIRKSRTGLTITLLMGLFFQLVANPYAITPALIAIAGLVLFYFRQSAEYLTEHGQQT